MMKTLLLLAALHVGQHCYLQTQTGTLMITVLAVHGDKAVVRMPNGTVTTTIANWLICE